MSLTPSMTTALNGAVITAFIAVQISLPSSTIRLLDGSGTVTFNGMTFTGSDPVGGTIAGISSIEESIATSAPSMSISLYPPSPGAIADIAAVRAQGSKVMVWFGLVEPTSGIVIPSPELLFSGRLDVTKITESPAGRIAELTVASVFDRLFRTAEGNRLTDSRHQTIWPGETGLKMSSAVGKPLSWGIEAAKQSSTVATTNPILDKTKGFYGL